MWRLVVFFNDGATPSNTLTEADGVVRLDSFTISPEGGSGDGAFTAVPTQVSIAPRNVIALEVDPLNDGSWERVYLGVVVACGNPRSDTPQPYRTVGIKQRLYERTTILTAVGQAAANDVAEMVRSVLNTPDQLPGGVTFSNADAPLTTFQLGRRFPNLESVGEFLDAMAATVGGFTVPTGSSYTYDGRTYLAGEYVPAVQWDVRPDGSLYFLRPDERPSVTFDETDARTIVRWNPINVETAVNDVTIVFFDAFALEHWKSASQRLNDVIGPYELDPGVPLLPEPIVRRPLALSPAADIAVDLVHRLDHPLDYMFRDAAEQSTTVAFGSWSNIGNATDLNPANYATPTTSPAGAVAQASFGPNVLTDLFRIRYSTPAGGEFPINVLIRGMSVSAPPSFSQQDAFWMSYDLPPTEGRIAEAWLVCAPPPRWPGQLLALWTATTTHINSVGGNQDRLYYFDWWTAGYPTPTPQLRALAESLLVSSAPEVAAVAYHGFGYLTRRVIIHPAAGSPINARAERIDLSITPENGVTTTYYLGQPFESDEITTATLMDRLARRAVAAGGRRR